MIQWKRTLMPHYGTTICLLLKGPNISTNLHGTHLTTYCSRWKANLQNDESAAISRSPSATKPALCASRKASALMPSLLLDLLRTYVNQKLFSNSAHLLFTLVTFLSLCFIWSRNPMQPLMMLFAREFCRFIQEGCNAAVNYYSMGTYAFGTNIEERIFSIIFCQAYAIAQVAAYQPLCMRHCLSSHMMTRRISITTRKHGLIQTLPLSRLRSTIEILHTALDAYCVHEIVRVR